MENETNTNKNSNSTIVWVIIGILVVAAIIVTVITTNITSTQPTDPAIDVEPTDSQDQYEMDPIETGEWEEEQQEGGYRVIDGTSMIVNGVVVNDDGEPVDNSERPGRGNSPDRTGILEHEILPSEVRKLFISTEEGFQPETFRVVPGQVVALALVSNDDLTHSIVFDDPSLSAIVLNVGPGQARAIVFNAPDEAGEYGFKSGVPRRDDRGAMIVE